jgi:hypothetical protein
MPTTAAKLWQSMVAHLQAEAKPCVWIEGGGRRCSSRQQPCHDRGRRGCPWEARWALTLGQRDGRLLTFRNHARCKIHAWPAEVEGPGVPGNWLHHLGSEPPTRHRKWGLRLEAGIGEGEWHHLGSLERPVGFDVSEERNGAAPPREVPQRACFLQERLDSARAILAALPNQASMDTSFTREPGNARASDPRHQHRKQDASGKVHSHSPWFDRRIRRVKQSSTMQGTRPSMRVSLRP